MNARKQKALIARMIKGVGLRRVKLNPAKHEEIKDAITRADLRSVVGTSIIIKKKGGTSTARAKKRKEQQRKGRKKGAGSKKGAKYSRIKKKELWMAKVRVQRKFLKELKEKNKLDNQSYRKLYRMVTGGFFRSKAHLKLYITTKMEK